MLLLCKQKITICKSPMYSHLAAAISHNKPFPSCFEPPYEREANCKVFVMKISFHSYANKANFHVKSFALIASLS